jgi:hypothetical protein
MSHTSRILQAMKDGCLYRSEDLDYLGIQRSTVAQILEHLTFGELVEKHDEGFRKRKVYKTKQKDLFDAVPQSIIDSSRR